MSFRKNSVYDEGQQWTTNLPDPADPCWALVFKYYRRETREARGERDPKEGTTARDR